MNASAGKKYLDPKILDKIMRLDVRARLVVEGFITGMHQSPYHGFAVEFASHREYTPGDDLKHVDWKVWSRTDRWYIKEYEEETNLKCTLLVDCSKSMRYGEHAPNRTSKFDYAATAAASLAYLLQRQQDAVGLVTFDNAVRVNLPPGTHPNHVKLLVHELEKTQPDFRTDVGDVFRQLAEQISRRGLIVLLSDLFVDLDTLRRSLEAFRHRRHEVVVFHVLHADELDFPFQDNTKFRGLELPDELLVEPRALRASYLEAVERFRDAVRKLCAVAGIDYVLLDTGEPLDTALSAYLAFRQRTQRTARGARRR
jgi:uncharacterized protein (DUF58 family)